MLATASTAELTGVPVYRSDRVPVYRSGGLNTRACDTSLMTTLDGHLAHGTFLNAATARYPVTVLGYAAAHTLGIPDLAGNPRIWLGDRWFTVVGILEPLELAPEIDRSALVGLPIAAQDFGYDGHPSRIYVRAQTNHTADVAGLLARATDPEHAEQVTISRPSDALSARLAVAASTTSLFLGLGAVALLVGGIGIANIMVISVLERRTEIGLRRALGAARRHVAAQFLIESLLLGAAGGAAGVLAGTAVTWALADQRGWQPLIPPTAVGAGLAAAVLIGGAAGLYPAIRAARLSPTDALHDMTHHQEDIRRIRGRLCAGHGPLAGGVPPAARVAVTHAARAGTASGLNDVLLAAAAFAAFGAVLASPSDPTQPSSRRPAPPPANPMADRATIRACSTGASGSGR